MTAPVANERLFTRSRRGYDQSEVDDYLARFAEYAARLEDRAIAAEAALEDCGSELAEVRARLAAARGAELSGRLAEILRLAEEEARDVHERSRVEAQAIVDQATRAADESRRAAAEQRLDAEHAIQELAIVRDRLLGDLRELGTRIMEAADRDDPCIIDRYTVQEQLPTFDATEALGSFPDRGEPGSVADDASSLSRN